VLVLAGLLLYLAMGVVSCTTARPTATYYFKPGPAYPPGPTPYKGVRYPTHP
jgi:hypothetical protein